MSKKYVLAFFLKKLYEIIYTTTATPKLWSGHDHT